MEPCEQLMEDFIVEFGIKNKGKMIELLDKYDIALKEKDEGKDLEQKINMYISAKQLEGLSPNTIKAYEEQLKLFKDYIKKPVDKIITADIRLYLAKSQDLSASTLNNKLGAIRTFFQFWVDEEVIPSNPASKRKIKPAKVPKRMPKSLSLEELELIRETCETEREKALTEILYSTGCRVSEVHDMDITDIDFKDQSIRVIGKGNKERIVYFNIKAVIFLKKYLSSRHDDNPALFVTVDKPHNRLGVRSIQRNIKAIAKRADIKQNVHPHLYRHTLATLMLENGADITTVQNVLGHESPTTTQIYAQRSEQKKKESYQRYAVQ